MKFKKILEAIGKEIAFFLPTNGRFWGSVAGFDDKMLPGTTTINPGNQGVFLPKFDRF